MRIEKQDIKNIVIVFGVVFMIWGFLLFAHVFYLAYYSESKIRCVDINYYNEAGIEWWLILVSLVVSFVAVCIIIYDIFKNADKKAN